MEGGHSFTLPLRGTRDVPMGNTEEATDSEPQGQPLTAQNLALLAGGQDEQKEAEEPEESEDEDEEMADKSARDSEDSESIEDAQMQTYAWSTADFTVMRQRDLHQYLYSAVQKFWGRHFMDRMPLKILPKTTDDDTIPLPFDKWPQGMKTAMGDLSYHSNQAEATSVLEELIEDQEEEGRGFMGLHEAMIEEAKQIVWERHLEGELRWYGEPLE